MFGIRGRDYDSLGPFCEKSLTNVPENLLQALFTSSGGPPAEQEEAATSIKRPFYETEQPDSDTPQEWVVTTV